MEISRGGNGVALTWLLNGVYCVAFHRSLSPNRLLVIERPASRCQGNNRMLETSGKSFGHSPDHAK